MTSTHTPSPTPPSLPRWQVHESFIAGKLNDPSRCEDMLVITPNWLGVIDGATDVSDIPYPGPDRTSITSGRFAATTLCNAFETLDPQLSSHEAIATLSDILRDAVHHALGHLPDDMPSAGISVFSTVTSQGFCVSDVAVLLDGVPLALRGVPTDEHATWIRAAYNRGLRDAGTHDFKASPDPGWDLIRNLVELRWTFINNPAPDHPFAYAVINGSSVPEHLVHLFSVEDVDDIVFASDGYPFVHTTLEESEAALADLIERDPASEYPPFQCRSVQPSGAYDDRAYLHLHRHQDVGASDTSSRS